MARHDKIICFAEKGAAAHLMAAQIPLPRGSGFGSSESQGRMVV